MWNGAWHAFIWKNCAFLRKVMQYRITIFCLALKQTILFSVNAKQGSCFVSVWVNMSCLAGFSLPVWWMANTTSLASLLLVLFLLSLCLFQSAWRRQDYPSSGFPLDREWAAFELSLTEASSHSQAVHETQVAQTYGGSCKEGDLRHREKRRK